MLSSDHYGGVHRRHIHQGLGRITGPHAEGTPAVSLDYAKCIDNVDPRLACDLLAAAGFPTAIVHMLRHTWQQKRFLELNGCVQSYHSMSCSRRLAGMWLAAPVAGCAAAVTSVLRVWSSWSSVLGLKENDGKRAIICSRPSTADAIGMDWVPGLKTNCTVNSEVPRQSSLDRLEAAMKIGKRLLTKSIALDVRRDLWRTTVLLLATWGSL